LTPLEIALAITILVLVGGYLQKTQCFSSTAFTNEYQYTHLCYTDTYVLYTVEGLNNTTDPAGGTKHFEIPYRDHAVEYPPAIGGLMWTAAELTSWYDHGKPDDSGRYANRFFTITALGLALCALITLFATGRAIGRRREWDVLMLAASPVLFMHAFTNWDLAAVALTALGLWAWSRRRPALAGLLLGLGIATKFYPLLVLIGLLMLCARERSWRAAGAAVGGAAAGVAAMYVPAIVITGGHTFAFPDASCTGGPKVAGWRFFTSLSQQRGTDWGSFWLVVQHAAQGLESHFTGTSSFDTWMHSVLKRTNSALSGPGGCARNPTTLNWISGTSVALVVAGVAALIAFARRRPRVGQVAFLLVAGFVMLNKVDSPQYALWLLPLAVMARPRWASLLVWQATEVVLGAANLYQLIALDHSDQGLPMGTYLIFIVIRDVVLVWLMAMVVREALDPSLDLVRRGGVDDPAGGVLVEADQDLVPDGGMVVAPV
jgi:hypothetical protein